MHQLQKVNHAPRYSLRVAALMPSALRSISQRSNVVASKSASR
ncbi:MAG: hypothetical protein ABSG67_18420 [Thermoguttaceae bacterium]